jgi:protein O-GlcNAc transferase
VLCSNTIAPYGAHTTSSDVLWAGVPVLTVMDDIRFSSRVAASLLFALDLSELVTPSWQDYTKKAITLVCDHRCFGVISSRFTFSRALVVVVN